MDTLASDGIKLDRQYAELWCGPSRGSLMTGRHAHHIPFIGHLVPRGMSMIQQKVQRVGYATYFIGKWDLGQTHKWMTPSERSFNSSFGFLAVKETHTTHLSTGNGRYGCDGIDLWRDGKPARNYSGIFSTFMYNDEVQRVLYKHKNETPTQPFFMYLATQAMHGPLDETPAKYTRLYNDTKFPNDYALSNGMISGVDDLLHNLTVTLRQLKMWNDTLIVVASDNGGMAARAAKTNAPKSAYGNNYPLRGGKPPYFLCAVQHRVCVSLLPLSLSVPVPVPVNTFRFLSCFTGQVNRPSSTAGCACPRLSPVDLFLHA